MRSYGQYCGLAKALDVVGDRWTLLIVRELLIGERRYTDLLNGLPGIATNLLTTRLEEMEAAGVIARAAVKTYRLTPRGEELRPVIDALGRWARPLLAGRSDTETVRTRWMALPAEMYLRPTARPVTIQIAGDDETIVLDSSGERIRARSGADPDADLFLTGPPELALAVVMGGMTVARAKKLGLKVEGDVRALSRLKRV